MKDIVEVTIQRNKIIKAIRNYFTNKGYLEVDTPILSPSLIPEATIEIFSTNYINPISEKSIALYLTPSPEIFMKQLLSQGSGNIFQIAKSFRNYEEISSLHSPEFTMLEWYTVGYNYIDSIKITEDLLRHIKKQQRIKQLKYNNVSIDLDSSFEIVTMEKLFKKILNVELSALIADEKHMNHILDRYGLFYSPSSTWEEKFNQLFLGYIEPNIPREHPFIIIDYPSKIKTLAKSHKNPDFVERWELYIGGVEIANCYTEEDDPEKIKKFFEEEEKRKVLVQHRIDPEFYKHFYNFPPCSGVAMGMDRLMMIFLNKKDIRGVIPFSIFDSITNNSFRKDLV